MEEGERWLKTAPRVGDSTSPLIEARVWSALGSLVPTKDPPQAAAALQRAIKLYRRLNDEPGLGKSLLALGRISVFMGRFEAAASQLAEALPLLERADLPKALARYFETIAFLKMLTGDLVSARANFEKALSLYRSAGAELSLAILLNLADMTWAAGDLDGALDRFREAVALIRKSSRVPKDMLGFGLTNLAGVYTERGDLVQALALAREGLPLRKVSDLQGALDHLALRTALAGKPHDAARIAGYSG